MSADLDALAAYVAFADTHSAASPYRNADGTLTATRRRRPQRCSQHASCAQCHGGVDFTDSARGALHDVGTLKPTQRQAPRRAA